MIDNSEGNKEYLFIYKNNFIYYLKQMKMKKQTNVSKTITSKKENVKLSEINLSQFADQLKDVNLKEKNVKETIYIYPETMSKEDMNSEKGKRFRNKLRNDLKRYCNNIFVATKTNDVEGLKKEIASFDEFYHKNYRLTDYSVRSLTNSEKSEKDVKFMLQIISEVKK